MNHVSSVKVDKNVLSIAALGDESDEKTYWWVKTPQERLQATELLRQLNYGYDPATARLQRVLTITELKAG